MAAPEIDIEVQTVFVNNDIRQSRFEIGQISRIPNDRISNYAAKRLQSFQFAHIGVGALIDCGEPRLFK